LLHRFIGLRFPNRLEFAAPLDKNGVALDALGQLGIGYVEVGAVTPQAQPGNARPRLFRLRDDGALINRMAFPNDGIEALASRLKQRTNPGICGVNTGKNALTSLDEAAIDYMTCLSAVYSIADYVAINVSSPNTTDLRRLQGGDLLSPLLSRMLEARNKLAREHNRVVPLLVMLNVDLGDELTSAARTIHQSGIDGIIVTNTTTSRVALRCKGVEERGLSGAPLLKRTLMRFTASAPRSHRLCRSSELAELRAQRMRSPFGVRVLTYYRFMPR
jgi:dihydroorotate dehydrogenase